jgi:hypothetical protein
MEGGAPPLETIRAIGRLEAGGPWIGFGYRAGTCRIAVGSGDAVRDGAADHDQLLALAIAYFAEAFDEAPPDLEATQSDLSALVRSLMEVEVDELRRDQLSQAIDAIDDGLAGDAVAEKLEAARTSRGRELDPVETLARRAREIAAGD